MKQQSLAVAADSNFAKFHKGTRRELFLTEMDQILPWCASIAIGNAIARDAEYANWWIKSSLCLSRVSPVCSSCLTTAIQRRCPLAGTAPSKTVSTQIEP